MSNAVTKYKIKIAQVVRKLLLANTDVVALIEDKIVPIVANDDLEGDFITYKRFAYSQEYLTKMGLTDETCSIMIECISTDYDRALEIGYVVSNYLAGEWTVGENAKMRLVIEDSDEDYKDKKYYQIFLFKIVDIT